MTLLGRQAGLPEVINGVLTTIGLRRRQVLDDVAGAIDATLHPARRSGAAGLVYREVVPDMSNAEHAQDSAMTTGDKVPADEKDDATRAQEMHIRQDGPLTADDAAHDQASQAMTVPEDSSDMLGARQSDDSIPSDAYLDQADDDADVAKDKTAIESMTDDPSHMHARQMEDDLGAKEDAANEEANKDHDYAASKMTIRQEKAQAPQVLMDDERLHRGNSTMTKQSA